MTKTLYEEIQDDLKKDGLRIKSHKPNKIRYYRVGKIGKHDKFIPISISMDRSELIAWYFGYQRGVKYGLTFIPSKHARK